MMQRQLFLRWCIVVGLVTVGAYLLWREGYVTLLATHDASGLSMFILAVFTLTTLYLGRLAWRLSVAQDALRAHGRDGGALNGIVAELRHQDPAQTETAAQGVEWLLATLRLRFKGPNENGWFIADVLFKLGLIGTVVGFILMLGAMSAVDAVDINTVQRMLKHMSEGMRVALFTTLTGLVSGVILGIQCQLLDRGADDVIAAAGSLLHRRARARTPM